MSDLTEACLVGRLNLFLLGDTGCGKTQLARDVMDYFPDNLYFLGRPDMTTRDVFYQLNPKFLTALQEGKPLDGVEMKELREEIGRRLIVVDELPNCPAAVRSQLFNLFDGYVEIDGKHYPLGRGDYSVGIGMGNIGQEFTESWNDLGRALRDRMHVTIDLDYFHPNGRDLLEILAGNTDPRVDFTSHQDREKFGNNIVESYQRIREQPISLEKAIISGYLTLGLDYCVAGGMPRSKRQMKSAWPNAVDNHGKGSDEALIKPVSTRTAKSIIRLSDSLDYILRQRGVPEETVQQGQFDSMMFAFRMIAPYSGILNPAAVQNFYDGDNYAATDAVIQTTRAQFEEKKQAIGAAIAMMKEGKIYDRIMRQFDGRWAFMHELVRGLKGYAEKQPIHQKEKGWKDKTN